VMMRRDLKAARRFCFLLSALLITALSLPSMSADSAASDAVFRGLILSRLRAHSAGDVQAYRHLLADDFVHVDDTGKRRTIADMAAFHGSGNASSWELGMSHTRFITPTLAIVECESTEFAKFGPRELRMPLQETDVFVYRDNRWLFLEHSETHKVDQPAVPPVHNAHLSDYVGRYQWWPGYEETITLRGDRLYDQATGDDTAVPLSAASDESFFVEGEPSIAVFTRDATGKVTGEVVHFPDGKVVFARKMTTAN
jgi:hypothetical protein